jgi:hypothetical protein
MSAQTYPPTSPPLAAMTRYTRLPPTGTVDPLSGLNRSALDKLVRPQSANDFNPPVKTKVLRARGARRGTVLIDVPSLIAYLNSLPSDQPVRRIRPGPKQRQALETATARKVAATKPKLPNGPDT